MVDHAMIVTNPLRTEIFGLAISAALFGFLIGTTMTHWWHPFKKIPAMVTGFFFVVCVYAFIGLSVEGHHGDQDGFVVFAVPLFAIYAIPILLAFAFIGRIFRAEKSGV